ncbi:hypothetical protein [Bifidobacterium simiarum]|uniref:hypothetical protein n=1 Tax=Bifidobacterium simiarum TaxID=2045441 RepID=UPI001BDC8C39|nr:hypothetical protein [Bifidobacterium simiarum]MBT1167278.1 hypothetical protein [Bifidobacterium simiarum]
MTMKEVDFTAWQHAWEKYLNDGNPFRHLMQWPDRYPWTGEARLAVVLFFLGGVVCILAAGIGDRAQDNAVIRRAAYVCSAVGLLSAFVGGMLVLWIAQNPSGGHRPPEFAVAVERSYGITGLDEDSWNVGDLPADGEYQVSFRTRTRLVKDGTLVVDGDTVTLAYPDGTILTPKLKEAPTK